MVSGESRLEGVVVVDSCTSVTRIEVTESPDQVVVSAIVATRSGDCEGGKALAITGYTEEPIGDRKVVSISLP